MLLLKQLLLLQLLHWSSEDLTLPTPSCSSRLLLGFFAFADRYRGSYSSGLKSYVFPFYCSYSGYQEELLWGAAWLHKATKNPAYLNYIQGKGQTLGANETDNTFRWDNKHVGARILLSLKPNTPQVFSLPLLPIVRLNGVFGLNRWSSIQDE